VGGSQLGKFYFIFWSIKIMFRLVYFFETTEYSLVEG
jgi:hypothetical protein